MGSQGEINPFYRDTHSSLSSLGIMLQWPVSSVNKFRSSFC